MMAANPGVPEVDIFREVIEGLEQNAAVGWENSVNSLRAAQTHYNTDPAQSFINKCFHQIITILLDQHPGKINQHQRDCVERSLITATNVLAKLLTDDRIEFLPTMTALFNKKKTFYKGGSINYWNSLGGAPEMRLRCIRAFAEQRGFETLLRILQSKLPGWQGADTSKVILHALVDMKMDKTLGEDIPQQICRCIMEPLSRLTEEELKKESTDIMSHLLTQIRRLLTEAQDYESLFAFWLHLTLTYVRSSSLPLRLFAWEQINELIDLAKQLRPPARAYLVKGAGVPYVNGVYDWFQERAGASDYRHTDAESGRVLTLFRCQMKSRVKWWFISEADKDQPGTDKDVDYYQQRANDELEPPPSGWVTCASSSARGRDPPPTLESLGPKCEPGKEKETREHQVMDWIIENRIVEEVFGTSMHREVVARSMCVLRFLSTMKALEASHLDMIWGAGVGKNEGELVEEIHTLLVNLTASSLTPALVIHLLSTIRASVTRESFTDVFAFVERLAQTAPVVDLVNMGEEVLDALLVLLWDVVQYLGARQSKGFDTVNEFFSKALKHASAETRQYSFLTQSLDRVKRSSSAANSLDFDEASAIGALQMTHFLLNVFDVSKTPKALAQLKDDRQLPTLLFQELAAFKQRARLRLGGFFEPSPPGPGGNVGATTQTSWSWPLPPFPPSPAHSTASTTSFTSRGPPTPSPKHSNLMVNSVAMLEAWIKLRLELIRFVHGFTDYVKLSFSDITALWNMLDTPFERELCMVFLSDACAERGALKPAFEPGVTQAVFEELICGSGTDWSLLGERAYACFNKYFMGLRRARLVRDNGEEGEGGSLQRILGLDALWRITLTASVQSVAEAAVRDLLSVYNDPEVEDAQSQFLRRIFQHLAELKEEMRVTAGEEGTWRKAERCLRLLKGAVGKSTDHTHAAVMMHGVRGTGGRRTILVEARRIAPATASSNTSQRQQVEKLGVSVIPMHPLESLGTLRRRVSEKLDHPVPLIRLMGGTKQLLMDEASMDDLGMADGAEVSALLMQRMPTQVYGPQQEDQAVGTGTVRHYGGLTDGGSTVRVGEVIAKEEGFCDTLFGLLDIAGTGARGTTCVQLIWDLLMVIPTEERAIRTVIAAALGWEAVSPLPPPSPESAPMVVEEEEDTERATPDTAKATSQQPGEIDQLLSPRGPVQWSSLISSSSWHRSVYHMQIIDVLVQPSEDYLEAGGGDEVAKIRAPFREAFISTGGFMHVLDLFMKAPGSAGGSVIESMATAVALRIVKFCLFGPGDNQAEEGRAMRVEGVGVGITSLPEPAQLLGGATRFRPLLDRLIGVACDLHGHEGEEGSLQVMLDALATIEMILQQPGGIMIQSFIENPAAKDLMVKVLLRSGNGRVRAQMRRLALVGPVTALGQHIFGWCLAVLESLEAECTTCQEFFDVLVALIQRHRESLTAASGGQDTSEEEQHRVAYRYLIETLAKFVAKKVMTFPRAGRGAAKAPGESSGGEAQHPSNRVLPQMTLLGCLRLVRELVLFDERLLIGGDLEDFVGKAFTDLLYAVPSINAKDNRPICSQPETRRMVLLTLLSLCIKSSTALQQLLHHIFQFVEAGAGSLRYRWSYECSADAKSADTDYVGLRNQGCTCYMNSLLQQLFMIPRVKEAILSARSKRRRLLPGDAVSDSALVGQRLLMQWENGQALEAMVTNYDAATGIHTIKYDANEEVMLEIRKGRTGKETGIYHVIPPPKKTSVSVVQEKEAAQRVLEQVQRTFCYMQSSEKRFFDPRALVEACKCLNLTYSVYQQNDATEFCDKLLDKLEEALKGTQQVKELHLCFGGKVLYQKIPQGCDHRSDREEAFIKVELLIRAKESIQDSLAAFVEGEMMDGENKVECEGCNTKKATIRRTCLGQLPNVLILHLKRFDLDYNTFETVKLNNRCAFPMRLNVKPYTKEGLEEAAAREREQKLAEERQKGEAEDDDDDDERSTSRSDTSSTMQPPPPPSTTAGTAHVFPRPDGVPGGGVSPMVLDDEDYEYELKGVVIHAGVAQGGHYYSFIKDRTREGEDGNGIWHRFDDEEVSLFDPKNIEAQCFGGTTTKTSTWQGVTNTIEQERVANALMLFYEKVRPKDLQVEEEEEDHMEVSEHGSEAGEKKEVVKAEGEGDDDEEEDFEEGPAGRMAFDEEVWRANVAFIYHSYLLDPQLHAFLGGVLSMVFYRDDSVMNARGPAISPPPPPLLANRSTDADTQLSNPGKVVWDPEAPGAQDLNLQVFRMGVVFLLDVILHSRDRPGIVGWLAHLKEGMSADLTTARWLLHHLAQTSNPWLRLHLLECPDTTARTTVMHLLVTAIVVLAPHEEEALVTPGPIDVTLQQSQVALILCALINLITEASLHWRHADELFILFREAAKRSDPVRAFLIRCDVVGKLIVFVLGDSTPPRLRSLLPSHFPYDSPANRHAPDYMFLLEAIATLVGVPQIQKVPLLEDAYGASGDSHVYTGDFKLTPQAKQALTEIFHENSRSNGMTVPDITKYLERCNNSSQQINHFFIKNMLQKYDTLPDGRLSLTGFLSYYRDLACTNAKHVWQDLHTFGFRNDLQRGGASQNATEHEDMSRLPRLELPELSRLALMVVQFYTLMIEVLTAETSGILARVCYENEEASRMIIGQLLQEISVVPNRYTSTTRVDVLVHMMVVILNIHDNLFQARCKWLMAGDDPTEGVLTQTIKQIKMWQQDPHEPARAQYVYHLFHYVLKELIFKNQNVRMFCEGRKPEWHLLLQYTRHLQGMDTGGGGYYYGKRLGSADSEDDSDYESLKVVVEGAGVVEVNGIYERVHKTLDGVQYFEREAERNGEKVVFTLYRCVLQSRERRWYISIVPSHRKEPGTTDDMDFYYCHSIREHEGDPFPPVNGWISVAPEYEPPPTVLPDAEGLEDEEESEDDVEGGHLLTPNNMSPTGSAGTSPAGSPVLPPHPHPHHLGGQGPSPSLGDDDGGESHGFM